MKIPISIITTLFVQLLFAQDPVYFVSKLKDNSSRQVLTRSALQDSLNNMDTISMVKFLGQMEKEGLSASVTIRTRVTALKARSLFYKLGPGDSLYASMMKEALIQADEQDEAFMMAEYSRWYSEMLNTLGKRNEAIQYALNSIVLQEGLGIQFFPTVNTFYFTVGELFEKTRNYEDALKWLNKAITLPGTDSVAPDNYANGLNNLGLTYFQLHNYKKSLELYKRVMDWCKPRDIISWYYTAHYNCILPYIETGEYDSAVSILKELEAAVKDQPGNYNSKAGVAYTYGLIANKKKDYASAVDWLKKAEEFGSKTGVRTTLTKVYQELSTAYDGLKQYDKSLSYYKEFQYLNDSARKAETSQQSDYLLAKANFEKQQLDLKALKSKREKDILLRNAGIAAIIVVSAFALWLLNRRRRKAMNMHAEAEKQLEHFREEIIARNQQVEILLNEQRFQNKATKLEELSTQIILTEEDWQRFQSMFNKVYPGFFHRLKEKAPGITDAELRLSSLIKIQLNTKQVAAMQGISSDAVHKTRQRLRQRFSTSSTSELEAIITTV